jgi:hypothetical protein
MKKIAGALVLGLALATSAFTSHRSHSSLQDIAYTNNANPPTSSPNNTITESQYLDCPLLSTDILCGSKWDVTDPGNPVLLEQRFKNVQ